MLLKFWKCKSRLVLSKNSWGEVDFWLLEPLQNCNRPMRAVRTEPPTACWGSEKQLENVMASTPNPPRHLKQKLMAEIDFQRIRWSLEHKTETASPSDSTFDITLINVYSRLSVFLFPGCSIYHRSDVIMCVASIYVAFVNTKLVLMA